MSNHEPIITWKHIGLYGYAVGTLAFYPDMIVWKSALSGRNDSKSNHGHNEDEDHLGNTDSNALATTTTRKIAASKLKYAKWTPMGKNIGLVRLGITNSANTNNTATSSSSSSSKNPPPFQQDWRLDGFPATDFDLLSQKLQSLYQIPLQNYIMSSAGTQYGIPTVSPPETHEKWLNFHHCIVQDDLNEEGQEFQILSTHPIAHFDLHEITQCVIPANNNRNEIELQFPETDTIEVGTDQLVSIRLYIPPDPDADPTDKETSTAAEILQEQILTAANIRSKTSTSDTLLVSFDPSKGAFLTPRGRYAIELYDTYLRMRGQKYDYKIRYDDINRLFLLPKPDEVHMAFVIALDKPIRQGNQRYQYLVMQASKDPDEVVVNMDDATLQKEYAGELQQVMRGSLSNLIAKTFKVIANKKVFIPGKFANANQQASLSCSVRANEGLLYPLEKQFVFIHKPPIIVRFNEIDSVEFQRYAGGQGSTRNFDLCVNLKSSVIAGGNIKDYTFSGIDRSDYPGLYSFLSGKKIPIKNLEQGFQMEDGAKSNKKPIYNEDEIYGKDTGGGDDGEGDEESDDESYGQEDAAKDAGGGGGDGSDDDDDDDDSDELDDDDLGSEVDDELDSDLEEARGASKKRKSEKSSSSPGPKSSKKSKKAAKEDDDDNDDDDDDDDDDEPATNTKKGKGKAKKDANAPKRGMSAYFMFMNENRNRIREENPDAPFGEIGKIAGAEWKKLSSEDRVKYEKMAATDKARYESEMKDYVPPKGSKDDAKNNKGKKAKAKKDPNAPKKPLTSFMLFSNENRSRIQKENPSMTFGELGKKIGELFRGLSSSEKQKYEDMSKKAKEQYKKQMQEYENKQKAKDDGVDDDDDDDDDDDANEQDDDDDDDDDDDE